MMHGRGKSDFAIVAVKLANKAERSVRSWWSQGRRPRGMRAGKARSGLRAGLACHRRWPACARSVLVRRVRARREGGKQCR